MADVNVPHEGALQGVAEIRMALLPMCVDTEFNWSDTAASAKGSESQARKCKLLSGRGLPGDAGCNKTSLFFNLKDGRKVSVIRHTKRKTLYFVVRVSNTKAEIEAERVKYRIEAERAIEAKKEREADMREYCYSAECFSRSIATRLEMLEGLLKDGNEHCMPSFKERSTLRLDCSGSALSLLAELKNLIRSGNVVPVKNVPTLKLIASA